MLPPSPQLVANRYELTQVIGKGGYGVVYRGIDRSTQQPVAVKVLSRGAAKDPDQVERMVREQQAMVALAGTGAVGALDLCELHTGQLCLVMEWLEGEDLERHLEALERTGQYLEIPRLLEICGSVADTLDRAHKMGIVHRDIKPANIFLTAYAGSVRLLDFGLSRMRWSKTLTQSGMVMGSPSYIAPETWRGESKLVDYRADLYALGVVVFRALSGQLPFGTSSLAEQMKAATGAARPSLRAHRPGLPRAMDAWAHKALAIDPAKRFQSAHDLCGALAAALDKSGAHPALQPGSAALPATLEEFQNAVASAFSAAASLLKRFAGLKTAPPPAPVAGPTAVPAPAKAFASTAGLSLGSLSASSALDGEDRKSHVSEWLTGADLNLSPSPTPEQDSLGWLGGAPTQAVRVKAPRKRSSRKKIRRPSKRGKRTTKARKGKQKSSQPKKRAKARKRRPSSRTKARRKA